MDKEEFEQLKSTVKQWLFHTGSLDPTNYANELKVKFIESREKRIAELEEKISVLLSCKNCPENKGGFICVKEYENKCLAQKIQYIKELREENAELKDYNKYLKRQRQGGIQKQYNKVSIIKQQKEQLTKAKELLERLLITSCNSDVLNLLPNCSEVLRVRVEAEQFLKDLEK